MHSAVLDASALGALIFNEPDAESIADRLADATIIAPTLIWFELASACLKKIIKYSAEVDKIMSAFQLGTKMRITTVDVDHAAVVNLAQKTRLTTYDASYLWLAQETGGRLITIDKRLADAASSIS